MGSIWLVLPAALLQENFKAFSFILQKMRTRRENRSPAQGRRIATVTQHVRNRAGDA